MGATASNLVMGPGTLYTGPVGAVEPADSSINLAPAASAWTDQGGTSGGVTIKVNPTYKQLEVDQIVDPVESRVTARMVTLETTLAEPTLANLQVALNNATTPVTGANYATISPPNDTSATQQAYLAHIFDGLAPGGFRRRIIARRTLSTADVSMESAKDNQTLIPVVFLCHFVSNSIPPYKIIDQTS